MRELKHLQAKREGNSSKWPCGYNCSRWLGGGAEYSNLRILPAQEPQLDPPRADCRIWWFKTALFSVQVAPNVLTDACLHFLFHLLISLLLCYYIVGLHSELLHILKWFIWKPWETHLFSDSTYSLPKLVSCGCIYLCISTVEPCFKCHVWWYRKQ